MRPDFPFYVKIRGIRSNAPKHRPIKTWTGQVDFGFPRFSFPLIIRHKAAFLEKRTPDQPTAISHGRFTRSSSSRTRFQTGLFVSFPRPRFHVLRLYERPNDEYTPTSLMTTLPNWKDYIQLDVESSLLIRKSHQAPMDDSKGRVQGTGSYNCTFARSILHALHQNRYESRISEILLSTGRHWLSTCQGILRIPRFEPWQDRRQSGTQCWD